MNYELLMKDSDGEIWSLDLPLDAPAMNYQINNLAELKDRNASYSQRISLPRTTHNEQAFQFSSVIGSGSYVPYRRFPCQLFYEGALISPAGAVLNIVDVSDESIGIQIVGATADLFDTLNNIDAKDPGDGMFLLKWYTDTMGQAERHLSGPEESKVLYFWLYATLQKNPNMPPVSMEAIGQVRELDKFYPHLNWYDLVTWIFDRAGYGLETDVDPVDRAEMFLPCTYPVLADNPNVPKASGTGWVKDTPPGGLAGVIWQGSPGVTLSDPVAGRLIIDTVPGEFSWMTIWDTTVTFSFSWSNTSAILRGTVAVRVTHYKNDGTSAIVLSRSWTSGSSGSVSVDIPMEAGEHILVYGSLLAGNFTTDQYDMRFPVSITAPIPPETSPGDRPYPGLTYDLLASTGFKSLGDMVKAFLQLFGLTIDVNPATKVARAYSVQEIYNRRNSSGKNWSDKLIKGKDTKLTFQLSSYAQSNEIKLEDNKDNSVTDSYKFSIQDVNLQPTKLLFQIGLLAGLNQALYDEYTQRLHTLANYPIWTINRGRMENGEMTETTWEYNALNKPMVVHINKYDYMEPKVSVGYALTQVRLYTARFKSLNYYVPKYYGKLIDNILKRPKILQTQILLDSLDIQSLDLFNPIWLEEHGFWFYVSKINNFQAGKITKVDLIRM
jgi:hypothetical protein|nr:MAG TPA: hypothetical protein [Caudoviricetes sp.]